MYKPEGSLLGSVRVIDHGPDASRFTIVMLAEGYLESERLKFRADCNAFLERLYQTMPFGELWFAMNVHCVDIASNERAPTEPKTTTRTFFHASFPTQGTLIEGDWEIVMPIAKWYFQDAKLGLVMVNSPIRGGSAQLDFGWVSSHPESASTAIHEFAHAAFGLADEYDDLYAHAGGGEPIEGQWNITTITDKTKTKWADLIKPSTEVPTMKNKDCDPKVEDPRSSPVPFGTVGLFEGAGHYRCGMYRPEFNCAMREAEFPYFCAVCRRVIREKLLPYMPGAIAPVTGVELQTAIPAKSSKVVASREWSSGWQIAWTIEPVGASAKGKIQARVQVERIGMERVKYWFHVTNHEPQAVECEAKYTIYSKV